MTAGQGLGVGLLVVWTILVAAIGYLAGARRGTRELTEPSRDEGNPLARELAEEVRRWQAESRHWQRTAERLQRELDAR